MNSARHHLYALRWQITALAVLCVLVQFECFDWLTTGVMLGGLFGIDSNRSSSSDSRVAGTDQAIAIGGAGTQTGLGENTLNVSGKSHADLRSGVIVENTRAPVNITTSDPDLFRDALASIERQSTGFSESLAGISGQTTSVIDAVLGKLTDLAESKQTDGESKRDQVFMWIALGLFAVVGIYFWRKHR